MEREQHESLRKLTLEDLVLKTFIAKIHFKIGLYCLVILIRTTKSRRRTSVARDRITISKSKSSSSWPISTIPYCAFLPDWNSFRFSVKDPLPLNFTCNHEWKHYSVFCIFSSDLNRKDRSDVIISSFCKTLLAFSSLVIISHKLKSLWRYLEQI